MEVRPGYKQTEVGVIPEDWEVESVNDISDGSAPVCYGIVQVGQWTFNGIPVLAIKNLCGDYKSKIHLVDSEREKGYTRSRVNHGDVVISVKGTIGRIGLIPSHFVGNISRELARIRVRKGINSSYVYHLLQSDESQSIIKNATVGTTRLELSIAILKQLKLPLTPTLAEHRAIAEALGDADGLIESLEQLIAKKRQIKQGAMQELLTGRRRLPGFQIKPGYKQTEVGMVAEDW